MIFAVLAGTFVAVMGLSALLAVGPFWREGRFPREVLGARGGEVGAFRVRGIVVGSGAVLCGLGLVIGSVLVP